MQSEWLQLLCLVHAQGRQSLDEVGGWTELAVSVEWESVFFSCPAHSPKAHRQHG